MKQAVQEGFILDVLKTYTPVNSYYKLIKKAEDAPEFDTKRAKKKLRGYVESHDHAIGLKTEIMVNHFHEQVLAPRKICGHARARGDRAGQAARRIPWPEKSARDRPSGRVAPPRRRR